VHAWLRVLLGAKGSPARQDIQLDPTNHQRRAWQLRWLRYVVITSVNRDDRRTAVRGICRNVREVRRALLGTVGAHASFGDLDSGASPRCRTARVRHNIGCRAPLSPRAARGAFDRCVLAFARQYRADVLTKSGFMVGLGETGEEVCTLLRDLHAAGADVATIGQYLQPTRHNLPVAEYVEPARFDSYRDYGLSIGFKMVFSGPLVRSSYMADHVSELAHRTDS
jgi:lipoic acid synthetase